MRGRRRRLIAYPEKSPTNALRSPYIQYNAKQRGTEEEEKEVFLSFSWEIWAGKMVVFCNAEEGKMERGHTSIAFPHVSTDAAFCEKKQKKSF